MDREVNNMVMDITDVGGGIVNRNVTLGGVARRPKTTREAKLERAVIILRCIIIALTYIIGFSIAIWFIASYIDVVTHNLPFHDTTKASWNLFAMLF